MPLEPTKPVRNPAEDYIAQLLGHFGNKGDVVLLDHRGRTYAGILQAIDSCPGLVYIQRAQQPLPKTFVDLLFHTVKTISRYVAADSLPLEVIVQTHADCLGRTLAPVTQQQHAYLMNGEIKKT